MKNKEKSNRAAADYFELLVCQSICSMYNITFSYSTNLAELSNQVLKQDKINKTEKLKLQNDNLLKINPVLKKILDKEIKEKGKIIKCVWLGRDFIIENTTSDVDAIHTKFRTRFSVKSTNKGNGTLKNIGLLKKAKSIFDLDFSYDINKMWKILENKLKLKNKSKRFIKDFCNTDKKALEFANKNAKLFQEDFTDKIFNRFNKLSIQKKIDFLNYVLDNKDKDLYVIVVSSEGVYIYQPADYSFNNNSKIMAKDKTDTGFNIYIDNKKFLNTQINCTNGLGISAWCMRVFLR